jgi:hypothetical protein
MIFGTASMCLALGLSLLPATETRVQLVAPAAAVAAATSYGFTVAEIERVLEGEVLSKDLKEGSTKELAGVVAVWIPRALAEVTDISLEGTLLRSDASIRSLHVWKRDDSAGEAFTGLHVDAAQKAMIEGRYLAYRKNGLRAAGPPGELLILAIHETKSLARVPGYANGLLEFPADRLPGMEHRFLAYEHDVEGRPAVILSHRAAMRGPHDALITEQRYYVSVNYVSRFIASDCFAVSGGTLMFYVSRVFTDQVAGFASGLKHSVGRRRMLATVMDNLKRMREQLRR